MKRNIDKFYRFALYGRSGSGKTCFLTTMAMGSNGYSRGLTSERMPVTLPKPENDDISIDATTKESQALHAGKELIDKSLTQLQNGLRPEANPPTFGDIQATVDFHIGSPSRGEFLVRTVDYSGELIHPEEEHRSDSNVNALKACLAEFDGLLVLAETPHFTSESNIQSDELRLLCESFASLRDSKDNMNQTPVAVVLTKWDRWSEIEETQPENEIEKLRNYLAQNLAHNSLVETIKNAQVDQANSNETSAVGLVLGNCGVFPTTAFGQSNKHEGFDAPVKGQQRPFGLLEPFLWLGERRDFLEANQLTQDWSEHSLMSWMPWCLRKNRSFSLKAKRLLRRVASNSPNATCVSKVRHTATRSFVIAGIIGLVMFMLVVEVGYETWRTNQFQTYVTKQEDPSTKEDTLRDLRALFDHYSRNWNGVFFSPSSDEALERVAQIDQTIENRYWSKVTVAMEPTAKYEAAKEYVKNCENGIHSAECKVIVKEHKAAIAKQENTDWLSVHQRESDNADNEVKLTKIQKELQNHLPQPLFANDKQRTHLRELKDDVGNRLAAIMQEKDWQQFINAFGDAKGADNPVSASQLLAARQPRDRKWEKVVDDFPKEVQDSVHRISTYFIENRRYDDARGIVADGLRALKDLETTIRPDNSLLADVLLKGQREMQSQSDDVNERHDKYLYGKVRSRRDFKSCQEYINSAPLKTMKREVKQLITYLERMSKPQTASVDVKIKWADNYDYGEDNRVIVLLNDVEVMKTDQYVQSTPGKVSGSTGSFKISGKRLNDPVKVKVVIKEEDDFLWLYGHDDDAGIGQSTLTIDDLRKGKTIKLRPKDGSLLENEARLILANHPKFVEPEMPVWKKQ